MARGADDPGGPSFRKRAALLRAKYLVERAVARFFAKRPYRLLVLLVFGALTMGFGIVWSCMHPRPEDSPTGLWLLIGFCILYSAGAVWYAGCIRSGTWRRFWQHILNYYL